MFSANPMRNDLLHARAYSLQCIREFFISKGYLEVETPLLAPALIPEACLEVFRTVYLPPDLQEEEPRDYYLIPSPEVWMKRLLAGGSGSIFQVTKCFRNVESKGKYHNPEFTMLEWYSVGHDYLDEVLLTEELLGFLVDKLRARYIPSDHSRERTTSLPAVPLPGVTDVSAVTPPFRRLSMQEACRQWAGLELAACETPMQLYQEASRLNLAVNRDDSWEEIFNKIFLTLVEPALPADKPLILYDYPALIPTLARRKGFFSERWELYIKGVEIANCYSEETAGEKVAEFITRETQRKEARCRVRHPSDRELAAFFGKDYPPCSGVALGIDRLLMVVFNLPSIKDIMLSTFSKD